MSKYNNFEGKKFGEWLVLERAECDSAGSTRYKCRCSCGKEKIMRAAELVKRNRCVDCSRKQRKYQDLVGKKFGNWLVLELTTGKYRNETKYKCECQCVKKTISTIRPMALITGASTKCKFCLGDNNKRNCWTGCGDISGHKWSKITHGAKTRDIPLTISVEYAWSLFLQQNKQCALSGLLLSFDTNARTFDGTASLDRIDSAKGYIEGNVQWIHKNIQQMKWNYDENYFLQMCKKITEHHHL
jgi:hypothetical protein